jgi:hypothetical protein
VLMLTEGLNWLETQRRGLDGEVRAAGRRGACEGVDAGRLQASDPHEQVQRRAGKPGKRLARPEEHQR